MVQDRAILTTANHI